MFQYTNAEGSNTLTDRDLLGWKLHELVERGTGFEESFYSYNARGQQLTVIDPSASVTRTTYNGFGDRETHTRPGSSVPHEAWTYDGYGRPSQLTMASGETLRFEYDPVTGDEVAEHWDNAPSSQKLLAERDYDALGRVVSSTYYNLGALDLGLGFVPEDVAIHHDWSYDSLDRVTRDSVDFAGSLYMDSKHIFVPSGPTLGWRRSIDRPFGSSHLEEYSDLTGSVVGIARQDNTASGTSTAASFASFRYIGDLYAGAQHAWADPTSVDPIQELSEFDAFAQRTRWTWDGYIRDSAGDPQDGTAAWYCGTTYDPARCGDPILDIDGVRDVMGRLRSVTTAFGYPVFDLGTLDPLPSPHDVQWRGYTYDEAGFFTREWVHETATAPSTVSLMPNAITNGDVNAFGGDLEAEPWDREREPTVGGLRAISNADTGAEIWSAPPRDPGQRLDEVWIEDTTFPLGHNAAGRLVEGPGHDFVYDARGRLVAAKQGGAVVELYLYDADGRLMHVERPQSGEVECFAYDGDNIIGAVDGSGDLLWQAVWGPKQDQLIEYHDATSGDWLTVVRDHRNSVVGVHSQLDGLITSSASYTAEGRLTTYNHDTSAACSEPGSAITICPSPGGMPFAFNSMWRSPLTGLSHMRNRWYSPRLGQFTTHDPLGYLDLFDLYGFAAFDPINGWDPFGLKNTSLIPDKHVNCMKTCGTVTPGPPVLPGAGEGMGALKTTAAAGGALLTTKNPWLALLAIITMSSHDAAPDALAALEPNTDAEIKGAFGAAIILGTVAGFSKGGKGATGGVNSLARTPDPELAKKMQLAKDLSADEVFRAMQVRCPDCKIAAEKLQALLGEGEVVTIFPKGGGKLPIRSSTGIPESPFHAGLQVGDEVLDPLTGKVFDSVSDFRRWTVGDENFDNVQMVIKGEFLE